MKLIRSAFGPNELLLIQGMDVVCFPLDTRPQMEGVLWDIMWENDARASLTAKPMAYCGWKEVYHQGHNYGFHYRAGVMPAFRGMGLQRAMLSQREEEMENLYGIRCAITYTDADNHSSMNNLIREGYKTYNPDISHMPLLSGEGRMGRKGFVHWYKELV